MSFLYVHFVYYYCSALASLTLIILFVKKFNFQIFFKNKKMKRQRVLKYSRMTKLFT